MRRCLLVMTVLVCPLARADELQTARGVMAAVLGRLAASNTISIALTGLQVDGDDTSTYTTTLVFESSLVGERTVTRFEVIRSLNGETVSRTVADGERMWTYDVRRNAYRSSAYASEEFSGGERDRLFRLLSLRAQGHQAFLARLLNETFGSRAGQVASTWAPWRPNALVGFAGPSIVCASDQPYPNQLTYIIEDVDNVGLVLLGADYYEETVISGRTRTDHWQMMIQTGAVPEGTSFAFVPPQGARAVAADEPRGGG